MNQILAMLQKRIAGVPAWGWALVIGGAVVAYAYVSRMGSDDGPQPAPTAPAYPADDLPSNAGDIPGTPTTPPRNVEITTNPAWIRYSTDRLVAEGSYGAVEVTNALTKALAGIELTEQESAIYNVAVRRFGAPPEGAPPIVVIPPTPKPGPPPTGPGVGAPTNLRVIGATRDSVTIAWNPAAGATGYRVHRGPAPYATYPVGMLTVMTWRGLKPGKPYTFSVRALGAGGKEVTSPVITAWTKR